jgi:TIR domain-containing protein/KAP-like P-loop domain-containing protein
MCGDRGSGRRGPMADEQNYVFVSYARPDQDDVIRLVRALEDRGILFRFDRDLGLGEPWQERLKGWLDDAGAVLVVWSARSAESDWILREASAAGDRLVPVTLDGLRSLPASFRELSTLDLEGWAGDPEDPRIEQLAEALRRRLRAQFGPAPTSKASAPTAAEVASLATTEPERAAQLALSIPDPRDRSSALAAIAQELAATNPGRAKDHAAAAIATAQSISDENRRSQTFADIADAISSVDPDLVAAFTGTAEIDAALQPSADVEFSVSVRQVRQELAALNHPVIAARLAAALQQHPGSGRGQFKEIVLDVGMGIPRPVDTWFHDVAELYDLSAVASSTHQVMDGNLVLAGLAELDPDLRVMLEFGGFLAALREEIEVKPRPAMAPDMPAREAPLRETLFDFSTDTPGLADDVKASEDRLGIEDDVRTLCRLTLARSTKPPLAIGLFGDWGTGKSFFMRRMQTRVREMQDEAVTSLGRGGTSPYCDNVVQIPFNAWHYLHPTRPH